MINLRMVSKICNVRNNKRRAFDDVRYVTTLRLTSWVQKPGGIGGRDDIEWLIIYGEQRQHCTTPAAMAVSGGPFRIGMCCALHNRCV